MIDLKQLLEERSAAPPTLGELRLGQVRRRITERRRRRIAAGALAAVVVLLLVGGYQLMPARNTMPPADPSPSASPSPRNAGFPEYTWGARLLAHATAPTSEGKVVLTWTPTTLDIVWSYKCDNLPEGVFVDVEMSVNGNMMTRGGCGGKSRFHGDKGSWTDVGVQIDKPSTISVTILDAFVYPPDLGEQGWAPTPVPATGVLAVAIYERIPFEDYPLPPRPAQLVKLDPNLGCFPGPREHDIAAAQVIRSDPDDPLKPMSMKVEWRDLFEYHYRSQTPGFLHLDINGIRVTTPEWWDYEAADLGGNWNTTTADDWKHVPGWTHPKQGQTVTITVTPEHVTGAWQLHVMRTQDGNWSTACDQG